MRCDYCKNNFQDSLVFTIIWNEKRMRVCPKDFEWIYKIEIDKANISKKDAVIAGVDDAKDIKNLLKKRWLPELLGRL